MLFGTLLHLPGLVLAADFHSAAAGWLAGTAAGSLPGAAAGGLGGAAAGASAGAATGALAGAEAGLALIDGSSRCNAFLINTVRRGQGRAAGAAVGHMKWIQKFGQLCFAYGIFLQHIRNDFNCQRASRSLLRQVL